jgi:hypothetical protein
MLGESDLPMISDTYDIDTFFKAIEEKDLLEIINHADREATAAWRHAYRQHKSGKRRNEVPDRYEQTLEELISFLRAALPYRPSKMDNSLYEQFVNLRKRVLDGKGGTNRPVSLKSPLRHLHPQD